MSNFNKLHMNALLKAVWVDSEEKSSLTPKERDWLTNLHSMTKRLSAHCETLRVEVLGLYNAKECVLSEKEQKVLGNQGGILRQVVIYGDNEPWLCARTMIPDSTLTGQERVIADLGTIPLGLHVFKEKNVRRDEIEIANVNVDEHHLLARRSCLWVNNKLLLVSELFLPQAPIYKKEG